MVKYLCMAQILMVKQGVMSLKFYHWRGKGHIGGACRESLARHAENLLETCNDIQVDFPSLLPPPPEELLKPEEVKNHYERQVSFLTI